MEALEPLLVFFKALADESRLRIVGTLAQQECTVGELAGRLRLTEPTVSHHLNRLRRAGLVSVRAEGTSRWYALDVEALQRTAREVFADQKALAQLAPEPAEDLWRRKVMTAFVDGETLVKIPSTRKKRRVILEWLVEKFERDVRYPEREINEVIQVHHWDSATLRREFIACGLMEREAGIYWRLPTDDSAQA